MHDAPIDEAGLTRRTLLARGLGAAGAAALGGIAPGLASAAPLTNMRLPRHLRGAVDLTEPQLFQHEALRVLGRTSMRLPDSLPHPGLPAGTDTMPEIEHVVILMLENHSYDSFFGMLVRGPVVAKSKRRPRRRGDGFTLGSDGIPTATNPYKDGTLQRAFHMPTTCQLHGKPSQEWKQSHIQFDGGTNQGFVKSDSGPVAMGYWDGRDLPFTYDLASRFPIGDRWFASCLAQTDPQRRYLLAATSIGMTDDIGGSIGNLIPDVNLVMPANGTICERLDAARVSWIDYYASFPTGATVELYPVLDAVEALSHTKTIANFFTDAAAGKLPSVTLLDPDYGTQSQEDPQNIVVGETFLAKAVNALGSSPKWDKTLLIFTYDEHGGYYDHVPPPVALAPDAIRPFVQPGQSQYDGFARYGFRVPSVLVGPYVKRDYVSHVVYDHSSILAFLERKWNLPAMTYRDANANDLTDFIDLGALAAGAPTFPELPALAPAGDNPQTELCSKSGAGPIPPPNPTSAPQHPKPKRKRKRRRTR
jgi:phospholipase C